MNMPEPKNRVVLDCVDSPDKRHCWHSKIQGAIYSNTQPVEVCCWCGIEVYPHGPHKPKVNFDTPRFKS